MNTDKKIKISVDPRMELLITVQILSNYNNILKDKLGGGNFIYQGESEYLDRIKKYFTNYKEHNAVKLINEMTNEGFWLGAPIETMLCLSNPPELSIKIPYNKFILERAGGREKLNRFVNALRNFAVDSRYIEFYTANKVFFNNIVKSFKDMFDIDECIKLLEDYHGITKYSYNIIINPLSNGSYGPHLDNKLYYICGLGGKIGFEDNDYKVLMKLVLWHEFSHPIINTLTEIHYGKINDYLSEHTEIKNKLESMGYKGSWDECINESIIRAITLRIVKKSMDKETLDKLYEKEMTKGFGYVPLLYNKLNKYENNRVCYPAISDFYNELLEVFK